MRVSPTTRAERQDTKACLKWTESQQRHNLHYLTLQETIVGRRSDVDLVLNEPNVSRRHFSIVRDENGYTLCDLGSSGGTFVNGQRIQQCLLRQGDHIRCGPDGIQMVYLLQTPGRERAASTDSFDLEKSLQGIASLMPERTSGASDLEKLSCLLDLHFNWGQAFSPEAALQTILKSALNISAAERGCILLKEPRGFRFEAGLDGAARCCPNLSSRRVIAWCSAWRRAASRS